MTRIIERVEAHYEVEEVEMGTVYKWCPESVVLECNCKKEITLTTTKATCPQCGSDHVETVGELLAASLEDEIEHPWRSPRPYYKPTRGT
jgi:Zn finger protein HypA/HybF involved in hydrogenase expression